MQFSLTDLHCSRSDRGDGGAVAPEDDGSRPIGPEDSGADGFAVAKDDGAVSLADIQEVYLQIRQRAGGQEQEYCTSFRCLNSTPFYTDTDVYMLHGCIIETLRRFSNSLLSGKILVPICLLPHNTGQAAV